MGSQKKKYVHWLNFEFKIILQKKKETWNWNQCVFLCENENKKLKSTFYENIFVIYEKIVKLWDLIN